MLVNCLEKQSTEMEQEIIIIPKRLQIDENETVLEKSGMHEEDSDEIDELLYSSSSEDDSDEGEVTSIANSPFWTTTSSCRKHEYDWNNMADCKRQRLLDGDHKQPRNVEMGCKIGKREWKKDNIQATLKSIIPGRKMKDPLSIIEEVIGYLKMKARALRVSDILQ